MQTLTAGLDQLREQTRVLCEGFPNEYWRETDRNRRYPQEFVNTLTEAGLLSALIPAEYGGLGLGLTEASVIMEEINKSGGHSAACHAQMYTMGALLRHGNAAQKQAYLPRIAAGSLRLQAFSITEDKAGSDTTSIQTAAVRDGDEFVITGHKSWTSRIDESDLLFVLARTSSARWHGPFLDASHSARGRCENRIKTLKNAGLRMLPFAGRAKPPSQTTCRQRGSSASSGLPRTPWQHPVLRRSASDGHDPHRARNSGTEFLINNAKDPEMRSPPDTWPLPLEVP